MKRLIMLPIFILFFNCCQIKPKSSFLDVKISNIIKIESKKDNENSLYAVNIDLINNTPGVIGFWTMTCSWQVNFIPSDDLIGLAGEVSCDSNYPQINELKPNQKKTFKAFIVKKDSSSKVNVNKFKIGFVFMDEKEDNQNGSDFFKVLEVKVSKKQDVIWSNVFELNK